ncbi:putative amino acid transporter, transmembrane domain-containing protein [Rosa chinensis]|uniref:Putative amino acid transporter, transmembrane domain-containing protein n=1 Tax=Rosa chinensis TaxID=74649 RepID=A0A2P6RA44_ROSCH|nr:putative amino acid transporter, transmembrane domain-containing protein [Rosa chinensis]
MKNKKQFSNVLLVCFILCTICYASMAVFGYLMFGSTVQSQITLNLPTSKISSQVAIYTTLVNPISKFALMVTPIMNAAKRWFPGYQNKRVFNILVSTTLVISCVIVALAVPFFAYLMALVGAFLSVTASIIMPCFCYLKISCTYRKIGCEMLIVWGIILLGAAVLTVSVCSVFAAAFSGSASKLLDLNVAETYMWAQAFNDLQSNVNGEIRNILSSGRVTVLKELEAVDGIVKHLYPMIQDDVALAEEEAFKNSTSDLERKAQNLSQGLDLLTKEVDGFFQILLTGREALLSKLRSGGAVSDQMMMGNVEGQVVSSIQVFMTVIKYTPQAYMNFIRKSTDGLSIFFILLDFSGGVGNSWVNFYGNIGKTLLSLICVSFDLLFICQHYVLYPSKKALISPKMITNKEDLEPLVSSDNHRPSV